MFKKIAITAILLGLFVAGSLIADNPSGQVGLVLTLLHEYNAVPYDNQLVKATINEILQERTTDDNGVARFGWKNIEGYYYLETEIDGVTYYKTVWKPMGVVIEVTWVIHREMHDSE
ncbi:MAG: hypothetical protein U9R23_06075 [Candidatus Cloacimonadota bacterium]|nr:hypothetical protein [Candidatus Cloacimonadota bacterium]